MDVFPKETIKVYEKQARIQNSKGKLLQSEDKSGKY